ncbi:response regulator transcription factor [Thiomicrorhabdus indica]|uniref:response regulator transcription factor n=1 Tax=Thiomicrorhabdus indica TaxID=2267253 RepID=UPI00102DB3CE|nr:response regulator [Thiomicrorhabdus indica]
MRKLDTSILVVDDDATFLRILGNALKQQKCQTVLGESPEQAKKIYTSQPIEYAILDLNIDGQSGLNVLQDLLTHQPDCQALILTGYASITTAVEAMRLGAIDYLCKPASVTEILTKLNTFTPVAAMHAKAQPPEEPHKTSNTSQSQGTAPTKQTEVPEFQAMSVKRMEWEHIQKVLAEHEGNISATAKALNMHRRTLQRKLQKRPSLK